MAEHKVVFSVEDIKMLSLDDYAEDEFAIAKVGFLGTKTNAHKLAISDEVLRAYASTVLGKFLVAEIDEVTDDATTHTPKEFIQGYVPREQEVEFVEEDGEVKAYCYVVISKIYAHKLCQILEEKGIHAVSVEMMVITENDRDIDDVVISFKIVGVTVLGLMVKPSFPDADIEMVRFSEELAGAYFSEKFSEERSTDMAEENYVNHPIDTSKEALYEGEWDGEQAKQDLIKEEKYETLAPKVCLRLEDGWKERQVTKLGYPVMCLNDGKWVYSRKGLASALGYAKQHDDNDIVNKVEEIYKKLGLDSERKEESAEMSEIEFAAVNIGDMWSKLYDAIKAKYPRGEYDSVYWIDSIWEEDNRKYAIIHRYDEDDLWRLDFSYTEEGLTLAEDIVKVDIEIVETDTIRKFAEPENIADYRPVKAEEVCPDCGKPMTECECHEDHDEDDNDDNVEMSIEEMTARIAQLEKDIEERDNIIMEKDNEIKELREFKDARLEQDKAAIVASVISSVEDFMDSAELENCKNEGMSCEFAAIDAWSNKVKASIVDKALKKGRKSVEFTRIAAPTVITKKSENVWDRI